MDSRKSSGSRGRAREETGAAGTKRAILERLKRADGLTAGDLAAFVGLSEANVRLHLDDLLRRGLVVPATRPPRGRGRPARVWHLADAARPLFPDRHADLSVHLIAAVRSALGEEALDQVIEARTAQQAAEYRAAIDRAAPLERRLGALAAVRTDEGYMAEVTAAPDGDGWWLVEHHCPVCEAASACAGLCRGELELFRAVLGPDAAVEREQHLLAGDARCTYRVRSVPGRGKMRG